MGTEREIEELSECILNTSKADIFEFNNLSDYNLPSYIPYTQGLNDIQQSRVAYLHAKIRLLQQEGFINDFREPALDVGTGIGVGAAVLRNLGINDVYGIDTNEEKLEKAITEGRLERSHAVRGNAKKLTEYFGKERFGTITAFFAPITLSEGEGTDYGFYVDGRTYESIAKSPWERKIPLQIVEVLQPNGLILFTVMTRFEANILKDVFNNKVDGDYKQIAEQSFRNPDAFIYSGRKL